MIRRAASIQTVADLLDVSADWIRDRLRSGELQGFRAGREIRVYLDSVDAYQQGRAYEPRRGEPGPRKPDRRPRHRAHTDALNRLKSMGV